MKHITGSSGSPNWIAKTGFWQVKGDPQQVLAWTASHVGRSHTGFGMITNLRASGRPETVWERDYGLPPVPAVEDTRELTVEVADAGNGQTAIRVDAQVTWLPARQASEMVPAAAAAITLSVIPNGNVNKKPPQPATITSPAAVHHITAMVNSQPVFPPGPVSAASTRERNSYSLSWRPRRGEFSQPLSFRPDTVKRFSSPWVPTESLTTYRPGTPAGSWGSACRIKVTCLPPPS
jgi:hypothetical protein